MKDLFSGKIFRDDQIAFCDEILYIICVGDGEEEYKTERISLDPQYDQPITLEDIAKTYPKVVILIADGYLEGYVFRYKNHDNDPDAEYWELVGRTKGFV